MGKHLSEHIPHYTARMEDKVYNKDQEGVNKNNFTKEQLRGLISVYLDYDDLDNLTNIIWSRIKNE